MAITAAMRTQVSQLYVALFGRAPDSDGLGYWVTELGNGKSLSTVADTMYATAPARAYYPTWKTNEEIISSFYVNVLGRTADAEGLAYWTAKLNAAGATPGSVIAEMITVVANYTGTDAAGVKSAALFNNKTDVAQTYAEAGGTIANATSILAGVTEAAATVTAAKATISGGGATSSAGQSYDLTANVETASGTSGDDIFNASTTDSGATLNTGDVINGGSGSDTLRITAQGVSPIVQLNSVETVDIRMLSATQSLNAISWSGVTQVNINSNSIDDTTLTVTNANQATQFRISDDANVVVEYLDDSGSTDTARLFADNGGVSGSAATFTVSATEAVNLGVSGASFVAISAGDTALKDVAVSGVGTLSLDIAETSLSGLSLAGFSGTSTVTLGAASNVNLTGGAGNDTFSFGTTFNGLDKVDGGAGANVLRATLSGIVGFNNVKNVQTGNFDLGGTTVADASGASFSTINISAIGASDDLTLMNLGSVVINLRDTGSGSDVTLDYAGGNADVALRSVAAANYSSLSITDASGIAISNVGASGVQKFDQLTINAAGKTATMSAGSGSMAASAVTAAGLGNLSISVGASGSFSNTSFDASALTSVSVNAAGASANASLGALSLNTASVTVNGVASGDRASGSIGNMTFGGSGVTDTVSLSANGSGAVFTGGNLAVGTGIVSLALDANGASALVEAGTVTAAASGTTTITVNVSGAQASAEVGAVTVNNSSTTTISLNLGGDSQASVGDIAVSAGTAAAMVVNVRGAASADASFGDIDMGMLTAASLAINFTMGSADLTVAGSAQATTISSISGTVGSRGTATFGLVSADTIGSITFGGSGSLQIQAIKASGVGAITISDGSFSGDIAGATTIGNLTLAGDGINISAAAAKSIGNIVVGDSNSGSVVINAVGTAAIGSITLGGGGDVTINAGKASGVGAINTLGKSGQVTLNLANASGQVIASLGAGSSDIYVSLSGATGGSYNGDMYSLMAGTGANYFRFATTANNDVTIQGFDLSSGTDRLNFATAGFDLLQAASASVANPAAGALTVQMVTSDAASLAVGASVIVMGSGTFADASALAAALNTAGSFTLNAATATTAGLEFIVVWADTNGDSHVSVVTTQASANQGEVLFSAITSANITDLALLDDVNVSTFSGTSYTDKFWAY